MSRPPARRPAPRATIEVQIDHLNADGVGASRHEGKEVLVPGTLPGEKVVVAIEHDRQWRMVGRPVKILSRHPGRVASPCRSSRNCQGCPLIELAYPAQLAFKQEQLRQSLTAYPTLAQTQLLPIWGAPQPLGYRTSAKLVFGRERGKVKLGLHRRGSHDVVDIGDCPVHHPLINRIATAVREEVERQGIYVYNPQRATGLLRYLAVQVNSTTGRALVTLVTAMRDFRQINQLAKWLQRHVPEVVGVHQNVNASEGKATFGRETLKMLGLPDLLEQIGEVRLRLTPTAFFQVNPPQAARIYSLVRQWAELRREQSALDLFCGIGGTALHLGIDGGQVTGFDPSEEAVRSARDNATLNGRSNCRFVAGEVAEQLEEMATTLPADSVVVVTPPRSGCEPPLLESLAALAPRTLLYVSCNQQTLARDLHLLAGFGYRTVEVQPVDMFPHTAHIEAVARLVPLPPASRPTASAPVRPSGPAPGRRKGNRGSSR